MAAFSALVFCSFIPAQVWLEELDLSKVRQDWGKAGASRSVDGTPLAIAKASFEHGLGTHAASDLMILVKGAKSFTADVGVDDETGGRGSVEFLVYVDGKRKYASGVMRGREAAKHVEVPLVGAKTLRLLVTDGGDGIDYDHADWANAFFRLEGTNKPLSIDPPADPAMPIFMGPNLKPEINGPTVVGCTPGRAFVFKIPASGQGPLQYSIDTLPIGLSLDTNKGILFGAVNQAGSYDLVVTVAGPKGKTKRELRIVAGDHKLALTPPMGWNSWNVWGTSVTAERVKAAADEMQKQGLADYGYRYVNIDDAWEGTRDANGNIQTNEKFGDMRALSEYVHGKGLSLGIYSSPGPKTCANYEASYQHEEQDARTYADWGVDYLKYDWCSYGSIAPNPDLEAMQAPYKKMRAALDASGRDIVFSLCQYGMGDVYKWGKEVGGNLWRTTGDITDSWGSMSGIAFAHSEKAFGVSPGGWNDPDMLVVGQLGWSDSPRPTHLSKNEQITHITMWSLLAAPLILGCDLTKLDPWTKALITNREVIDIDQDAIGKAATRVSAKDEAEVWSRPLADGTIAVGLMNRGLETKAITVSWAQLGLAGPQKVRDLWMRKDLGRLERGYTVSIPSHGAKLIKVVKP